MTGQIDRRIWGRVSAVLFVVALCMTGLLGVGPLDSALVGHAVPEDGPSANTPGTKSKVWPTKVALGGKVNYTITGFPAGETVYIKIDDGQYCDQAAVHGACVVATQRIKDDGSATGSVYIPDDIPVGKTHWLRFLASAPAENGDGVVGYTHRGAPEFEIYDPDAQADDSKNSSTVKKNNKKTNNKKNANKNTTKKNNDTTKKSGTDSKQSSSKKQSGGTAESQSTPEVTTPESSDSDTATQEPTPANEEESAKNESQDADKNDEQEPVATSDPDELTTADDLPWDPNAPAATQTTTPTNPDIITAGQTGQATTKGTGVGTWLAAAGGATVIIAAAGATMLLVRRRRQ